MTVAKRMDPQKSEEARECYELSLAGYSQRQIADKMGHSQSWVRDRLKLHTENRVHPKADEYRAQQIDRARIYIRSLWSQVLAGDPKAIAQAIRTEERISKLLGLDSATQYVVKSETEFEMDPFLKQAFDSMGRQAEEDRKEDAERAAAGLPALPRTTFLRRRAKELEAVQQMDKEFQERTGIEPPRRELSVLERAARKAIAAPLPDEFAKDNAFQPHEVNREAVEFADDVEEFEPAPQPKPRRRGKPIPNPAAQFLVDSDD